MDLPSFRYHPDPLASGSVVPSSDPCVVCGEERGFLYEGPLYCEDDRDGSVCPWCIADGSAHRELDATFVDSEAFTDDVPAAVVEAITERTPGFASWGSDQWPACCNDAAAFIQSAGIKEIRAIDPTLESAALDHIVRQMGVSGTAATRLLNALDRERGPTAHVFRCLRCRAYRFEIDAV